MGFMSGEITRSFVQPQWRFFFSWSWPMNSESLRCWKAKFLSMISSRFKNPLVNQEHLLLNASTLNQLERASDTTLLLYGRRQREDFLAGIRKNVSNWSNNQHTKPAIVHWEEIPSEAHNEHAWKCTRESPMNEHNEIKEFRIKAFAESSQFNAPDQTVLIQLR